MFNFKYKAILLTFIFVCDYDIFELWRHKLLWDMPLPELEILSSPIANAMRNGDGLQLSHIS